MLTVPVAGTSMMLMDPYVSARSISTPCSLLALVALIDMVQQIKSCKRPSYRSVILAIASLLIAAAVHPLIAGYALGCTLTLAIAALTNGRMRWALSAGLWFASIAIAVCLLTLAPLRGGGYSLVVATRTYWFLNCWHWYEVFGLAAPLLVIAMAFSRTKPSEATQWLSYMCLVMGALAVIVALLFARSGMSNFAVARLQPLRVFQIVYVITLLIVGTALGKYVLKRSAWRWGALIGSIGSLMMFVQLVNKG
jgi:hypothetical protein